MKYKISDINSSSISTSTTKNNIDRNNTIFKQIWQIGNKHLVIIDESIILKLGIIDNSVVFVEQEVLQDNTILMKIKKF